MKESGRNKLGHIRHDIAVSEEYFSLGEKDEEAARILMEHSRYRHSIYFFIQAMEKYIRSKIFSLVNPNIEYFREKNKNHSLDSAIDFLSEIISSDTNIQKQIKTQINDFIFEGINFQLLHNNLRYPFYNAKYNDYSCIDFDKNDCSIVERKVILLKQYLKELDKLKNT
jgi:HEPN domain-containing protein